jgi:hypothetical protein
LIVKSNGSQQRALFFWVNAEVEKYIKPANYNCAELQILERRKLDYGKSSNN